MRGMRVRGVERWMDGGTEVGEVAEAACERAGELERAGERASERASTGERARASELGLQKVVAQVLYSRTGWRVAGEG